MTPKVVVTCDGHTFSRRSARPYTHAVLATRDANKEAEWHRARADRLEARLGRGQGEWLRERARVVADMPNKLECLSWHQGDTNARRGLERAKADYSHCHVDFRLVEVDR